MTEQPIQVYRYDLAPQGLRDIANQGGDEDWIVVIPADLVEEILQYGVPFWVERMDAGHEPVRIDMPSGDVLFVGCH